MSQASIRTGYRGALGSAGSLPRRVAGHRKILALGLFALALLVLGMFSSSAPSGVISAEEAATPEAVQSSQPATPPSDQELLDAYAKLPLSFIPNAGQTDEAVRYYAQDAGYGFYFTPGGAMLSFTEGERGAALALDFLEADPDATLEAREQLPGKVNYLVGNDPTKWQQGLPTHGELVYRGVWPGIDMFVRGEEGKLKYEFHVQSGASIEDIGLAYRGAQGLSLGAEGELLVETPLGVLEDAAPASYQVIDGERVPVESRYALRGDNRYGFEVGAGYDPARPLVIDPGLAYSTFLGTTGRAYGYGIAVDLGDKAYVTGVTRSADFPVTRGAFDTTYNGGKAEGDAFVTKLSASGSALRYSTFLGGRHSDLGLGIVVGSEGNAYVTGSTYSPDFPTTRDAFDTTLRGDFDAFVTKMSGRRSQER